MSRSTAFQLNQETLPPFGTAPAGSGMSLGQKTGQLVDHASKLTTTLISDHTTLVLLGLAIVLVVTAVTTLFALELPMWYRIIGGILVIVAIVMIIYGSMKILGPKYR